MKELPRNFKYIIILRVFLNNLNIKITLKFIWKIQEGKKKKIAEHAVFAANTNVKIFTDSMKK
jgi:hypothetical protein